MYGVIKLQVQHDNSTLIARFADVTELIPFSVNIAQFAVVGKGFHLCVIFVIVLPMCYFLDCAVDDGDMFCKLACFHCGEHFGYLTRQLSEQLQ